jgi:hypothetical protein
VVARRAAHKHRAVLQKLVVVEDGECSAAGAVDDEVGRAVFGPDPAKIALAPAAGCTAMPRDGG